MTVLYNTNPRNAAILEVQLTVSIYLLIPIIAVFVGSRQAPLEATR